MRKGYVIVYRDNLHELATTVVYEHKEVAMQIMANLQALDTERELDVQPIDIDTRTVDKLER